MRGSVVEATYVPRERCEPLHGALCNRRSDHSSAFSLVERCNYWKHVCRSAPVHPKRLRHRDLRPLKRAHSPFLRCRIRVKRATHMEGAPCRPAPHRSQLRGRGRFRRGGRPGPGCRAGRRTGAQTKVRSAWTGSGAEGSRTGAPVGSPRANSAAPHDGELTGRRRRPAARGRGLCRTRCAPALAAARPRDQWAPVRVPDSSLCSSALESLSPVISTSTLCLRKCSDTWSRAATAEESHTCASDMSITTFSTPSSA